MRGTLRAVAYFLQEAAQSLWRSRLIGALSVGTIAISLFLLGAFLAVASNLAEVVDRWTRKVQVTIYLRDGVDPRDRDALVERLRQDPAVEMVEATSRDEALARFRAMFRDLAALPEDLGTNPFPASLEATLKPGHHGEAELRRPTTPSAPSAGWRRCSTTCSGSSAWAPRCAWCAAWPR
jgi:cell division transport system permease protein